MRKLTGAVLVALLIPAAVAAQRPGATGDTRMAPRRCAGCIASDAAAGKALARVRSDLAAGKLSAWGDPHVLTPASVVASRTLFNPTGGKDGGPIYLVFASAPAGKGEVRVALNAETGAILNVLQRDWNGTAPDWWVSRLDEDPIGTRAPQR